MKVPFGWQVGGSTPMAMATCCCFMQGGMDVLVVVSVTTVSVGRGMKTDLGPNGV